MDPQSLCIIEPLSCWAVGLQIPPALPFRCDQLSSYLCLVSAEAAAGKIFGFAEFVQAFALLILVYTTSDSRSRFRVAVAPIRLPMLIFVSSIIIGLGTLSTDWWFQQKYPIPTLVSNQLHWQAAFGVLFLALALSWIWWAYVRPPKYGRLNAYNFTRALHDRILQGDDKDLPVVTGELFRSAASIVKFAPLLPSRRRGQDFEARELRKVEGYAQDILQLIAHRKFCRHIVASSPGTAMAFFRQMTKQRKYRIAIGQFGVNIATEAILNKDSPLYHEDEQYYSGYFGAVRPFTNALFSDYELIEALSESTSPLDVNLYWKAGFDADQLEVYCRATLTTFASAMRGGHFHEHSFALARAFNAIEHSCGDLYRLNDTQLLPDQRKEITRRLQSATDFLNEAIKILDEIGIQPTQLRRHGEPYRWKVDYYDKIARVMFEIIGSASRVTTAEFLSWEIQHNMVWSEFFSRDDTETRAIILFKLRRLLFEEIKTVGGVANFRNTAYLGFCLNVCGIRYNGHKVGDREQSFRRAVISWTTKNFLKAATNYPRVIKASLPGKLKFNAKQGQLEVTNMMPPLRGRAKKVTLKLL